MSEEKCVLYNCPWTGDSLRAHLATWHHIEEKPLPMSQPFKWAFCHPHENKADNKQDNVYMWNMLLSEVKNGIKNSILFTMHKEAFGANYNLHIHLLTPISSSFDIVIRERKFCQMVSLNKKASSAIVTIPEIEFQPDQTIPITQLANPTPLCLLFGVRNS